MRQWVGRQTTDWLVGTESNKTGAAGRPPRQFAVMWAGRGVGGGWDQRLDCGPALLGEDRLGWGHGWKGSAGGGRQGQEKGEHPTGTGMAGLAHIAAVCVGLEKPSHTEAASGAEVASKVESMHEADVASGVELEAAAVVAFGAASGAVSVVVEADAASGVELGAAAVAAFGVGVAAFGAVFGAAFGVAASGVEVEAAQQYLLRTGAAAPVAPA